MQPVWNFAFASFPYVAGAVAELSFERPAEFCAVTEATFFRDLKNEPPIFNIPERSMGVQQTTVLNIVHHPSEGLKEVV